MAHVLAVHADQAIRTALAEVLGEEATHNVVSTSDAELALAALWYAPDRLVALIDEGLPPFDAFGILAAAANEAHNTGDGPLSRHRYIVMSTVPDSFDAKQRQLLSRLGAQILPLPFELDTLLEMVDDAAHGLALEETARHSSAHHARPA